MLSADPAVLRQQAIALQRLLLSNLTTWAVSGLPSHELVARLQAERDEARLECEEHMTAEGRLQQQLADAAVIMNGLARSTEAAAVPQSTSRAEKIANRDTFDGARGKLKPFKDQLMLKTSGNAACCLNTQHKLRYAYQFLTGKAQRTMWIYLRRTADLANGEETYEIAFDTFAAFLTVLDRHFYDPDKKHTAFIWLDKLRQSNQEFGAYYADFQDLIDILETTDDTSRPHALRRGLNHEMLRALAIFPARKDESFDAYLERHNELDCCLRALNTHSRCQPQHHMHPPTTATATATTTTGTTAGPMDLSASRGKLSTAERSCRRAQGLCMYCGGVGHFAAECLARRKSSRTGRRALAGANTVLTPDGSDSESGKEEAQK